MQNQRTFLKTSLLVAALLTSFFSFSQTNCEAGAGVLVFYEKNGDVFLLLADHLNSDRGYASFGGSCQGSPAATAANQLHEETRGYFNATEMEPKLAGLPKVESTTRNGRKFLTYIFELNDPVDPSELNNLAPLSDLPSDNERGRYQVFSLPTLLKEIYSQGKSNKTYLSDSYDLPDQASPWIYYEFKKVLIQVLDLPNFAKYKQQMEALERNYHSEMTRQTSLLVSYSAFDKARILSQIPVGDVALVADQEAFEKKFASQASPISLDAFRAYSHANTLLQSEDPIEIVKYIETYGNTIDWQYLLNLVPSRSAATSEDPAKMQQDFLARVPNLNVPVTIEQQIQKVGTSQTAIGGDFTSTLLSATANLLIERGQKELANAFFDEITAHLENSHLQLLLPNTAELFRSKDVYTVPSLGSTWKGAFELDIRSLPMNGASFIQKAAIKDEDIGVLLKGLVQMSDDLISGDHPMHGISRLNQKLPSQNRFKSFLEFVDQTSQSLRIRRHDGAAQNSPWATAQDFQNLGAKGGMFYIGFLMNDLRKKGIIATQVNYNQLDELSTDVQVLINRLQRINKAIRNEDDDSFQQLMANLTEIFEISVALTKPFEKHEIKFKELPSTLERVVQMSGLVNDTYQAIQSNDYGKVLSYMLKIVEQVNTKTYGEIHSQLEALKETMEEEIKKIDQTAYEGLIENLKEYDYTFSGSLSMKEFVSWHSAQIQQLISKRVLSGKDEQVRQKIEDVLGDLAVEYPQHFFRMVSFISEISMAKTEDEVKNVLDSFILPVGSFRLKRMAGTRNLMLQGYAGGIVGHERTKDDVLGGFGGLFLPVGLSYTWAGNGGRSQKANYTGIFVSVVDLGSIGSFNFSGEVNDSTGVANEEISLENVMSPGLFFEVGWKNIPITTGIGYRFATNLRKIGTETEGVRQIAFYLVVDIPLLKIYRRN